MNKRTEAETLLGVYESVRNLSKFFFSKIGDIDIHRRFEIGGVRLNSIHWIISHLCWTENLLILRGVGNTDAGIPWLEEYGFGSNPDEVSTVPELEELLSTLEKIHERAAEIIKNLTDDQLEEDNYLGAAFGNNKSKRMIITHAIRHEPMHIGQLSWALKLNGITTV